jgi:hypothetical protein
VSTPPLGGLGPVGGLGGRGPGSLFVPPGVGSNPRPTPDERALRARQLARRARTLALAAFTALLAAVSALGVAVQVRNRDKVPVLHDQAFVTAANHECALALDPTRFNRAPADPAENAARIDSQATTLEGVAARLRALPVDPADQAAVADWLAAWDTFSAVGHRYAGEVRAGDKGAGRVAQTATPARTKIDEFAAVNHLRSCGVG